MKSKRNTKNLNAIAALFVAVVFILLTAMSVGLLNSKTGAENYDYPDMKNVTSVTQGASYQITDEDGLVRFAELSEASNFLDCNIYLANDIALKEAASNFTVISPVSTRPFAGRFVGNGYSIYNIGISQNGVDNQAFFGYIAAEGKIENLNLKNMKITGRDSIALLASFNAGTIDRVSVQGTVNASSQAGLIASTNTGSILNCTAEGTVIGTSLLGGIAGVNLGGKIFNSSVSGVISLSGMKAGGIVGVNQTNLQIGLGSGTISNVYANVSFEGELITVGYIAGENYNASTIECGYYLERNGSGLNPVETSLAGVQRILVPFESTGNLKTSVTVGNYTGTSLLYAMNAKAKLLLESNPSVMYWAQNDSYPYLSEDNANFAFTVVANNTKYAAYNGFGDIVTGSTPLSIEALLDALDIVRSGAPENSANAYKGYYDCTLQFGTGGLYLNVTEPVILKTGNYKLIGKLTGSIGATQSEQNSGVVVVDGAKSVTSFALIENSCQAESYVNESDSQTYDAVYAAVVNKTASELIVADQKIECAGGYAVMVTGAGSVRVSENASLGYMPQITSSGKSAIYYSENSNGDLIIEGGELTTSSLKSSDAVIEYNASGAVKILGGVITNEIGYGVIVRSGSLKISGSKVETKSKSAVVTAIGLELSGGSLISSEREKGVVYIEEAQEFALKMSGGSIESKADYVDGGHAILNESKGKIEITAGTVKTKTDTDIANRANASAIISLSGSISIKGESNSSVTIANKTGAPTIQAGSGEGTLFISGATIINYAAGGCISSSRDVTVEKGILTSNGGDTLSISGQDTALSISGGEISVTAAGNAVKFLSQGTLRVSGGKIFANASGATAILLSSGANATFQDENELTIESTSDEGSIVIAQSETVGNIMFLSGKVTNKKTGGYAIFAQNNAVTSLYLGGGSLTADMGVKQAEMLLTLSGSDIFVCAVYDIELRSSITAANVEGKQIVLNFETAKNGDTVVEGSANTDQFVLKNSDGLSFLQGENNKLTVSVPVKTYTYSITGTPAKGYSITGSYSNFENTYKVGETVASESVSEQLISFIDADRLLEDGSYAPCVIFFGLPNEALNLGTSLLVFTKGTYTLEGSLASSYSFDGVGLTDTGLFGTICALGTRENPVALKLNLSAVNTYTGINASTLFGVGAYSTLTFTDGKYSVSKGNVIENTEGGKVVIQNGSFRAFSDSSSALYNGKYSTAIINGGSFNTGGDIIINLGELHVGGAPEFLTGEKKAHINTVSTVLTDATLSVSSPIKVYYNGSIESLSTALVEGGGSQQFAITNEGFGIKIVNGILVAAKEYIVAFDLQGIDAELPEDMVYLHGDRLIGLPVIVKDLMQTRGWSLSANGPAVSEDSIVERSMTLYAIWGALTYKINYHLSGGVFEGEYKKEYAVDEKEVILPRPVKANYSFDGWYRNESLMGVEITKIPSGSQGDVNVYAKWSIVTPVVNISKIDNGDNTVTLRADFEMIDGFSYSFEWELYVDGMWVHVNDDPNASVLEGNSIIITKEDTRQYRCLVRVSDGTLTAESIGVEVVDGLQQGNPLPPTLIAGIVLAVLLLIAIITGLLLYFFVFKYYKITIENTQDKPIYYKFNAKIELDENEDWFVDAEKTMPFIRQKMPPKNLVIYSGSGITREVKQLQEPQQSENPQQTDNESQKKD